METVKALTYFDVRHGDQSVFQFGIINFLVAFQLRLNTCGMGLRQLDIFLLLQCGDRLLKSESDVYRRQIPTSKVYASAVTSPGQLSGISYALNDSEIAPAYYTAEGCVMWLL